jgi:hypothetical protein
VCHRGCLSSYVCVLREREFVKWNGMSKQMECHTSVTKFDRALKIYNIATFNAIQQSLINTRKFEE